MTTVKTVLLFCTIKIILLDLDFDLVVYYLGSSLYLITNSCESHFVIEDEHGEAQEG